MLPLRYAGRWRLAGGIFLALVLALALMPDVWSWLPGRGPGIPGVDKWLHGLTFALLALWFAGQYARGSYWWIVLGLSLYGVIIEMGQSFLPYRMAEWGDLAADSVGTAIGILIALVGAGGWSLRAENWLENRIG